MTEKDDLSLFVDAWVNAGWMGRNGDKMKSYIIISCLLSLVDLLAESFGSKHPNNYLWVTEEAVFWRVLDGVHKAGIVVLANVNENYISNIKF